MRHRLGYKKLNRTSEHRKALIKNMLNSLIKYEQITTTLPKAKVLKPQAEKIITLGKNDKLHNMKSLVSKLQDIKSANKVRKTLAKRYESRKGGYTRIIKAGYRYGDNAPLAVIEFVDRDVEAKKVDRKKKEEKKKKEDDEENDTDGQEEWDEKVYNSDGSYRIVKRRGYRGLSSATSFKKSYDEAPVSYTHLTLPTKRIV